MAITTVIYDLDGTLVDTELAASRAILDCFREWGLSIAAEDSRYITGRTWASAFDYLFRKYRLPVTREEAGASMMARYREALETELRLVPGGADSVKALHADGRFRLGLVSGSSRQEIHFCLDRLGVRDRFEIILGCEDYPRSKPAPDGFRRAIETLAAKPEGTLIFEDSEAGIASARAAGAWVVAIQSTNHFGQDTTMAHAHIPDLRGVNGEWIRNLRLEPKT